MTQAVLGGMAVRVIQAAVQSAPTLLVGLLVVGVFRHLLGAAGIRKLFGAGSWRSLLQAWAVGMLLPVCSLGVIPVMREMRRAGIAGSTVLAFALSAPLFNPISLLFGLTLSEPLAIFAFAGCSLLVVTVVGLAWDWKYPQAVEPQQPAPPVAAGIKRMLAIGAVAAREMCGATLGYGLVALVGVAGLTAALPPGTLQHSLSHGNPWAPLLMTAVAIPAYATPMTVMGQLASMFKHGNSVGAAFVLLTFGAGINLGTIAYIARNYRLRPTLIWLVSLVAVVVALAYAVDAPLFPQDVEIANHTHAFDGYCCPFRAGSMDVPRDMAQLLHDSLLPHEISSAWLVLGFLGAGLGLRLLDRRWRLETWLEAANPAGRPVGRFDLRVPAPVLGAVALGGLVAFSIVGCFMYYPHPDEALDEMSTMKTEALHASLQGDRKVAEHWIAVCDDWTHRLQVGVYLRTGKLSEYQRMKARVLRDDLELLEHSLAHNDEAERKTLVFATDRAFSRLRAAFRTAGPATQLVGR